MNPVAGHLRFSAQTHTYFNSATGAEVPGITFLLKWAGLVDDTWFTEESSDRGTTVHAMTADYDLGALEPAECVSVYRPYLLAYVGVMKMLRPSWQLVEEIRRHPVYNFAGRPDRAGVLRGLQSVCEIKTTAAASEAHQVQTALQAILLSPDLSLPPRRIKRYCCYLKPSGKGRFVEHDDEADFDEAFRILRDYNGVLEQV